MKLIYSLLILFLVVHSVTAWPLDLKINQVVMKSNDVKDFYIDQISKPYIYPLCFSITATFNTTPNTGPSNTLPVTIYFLDPDQHSIVTDWMHYDAVNETAPNDLYGYGSYPANIGGLQGQVSWYATTTSMRIVGITQDNGTTIAASSAPGCPMRGDSVGINDAICARLSAFNASIEKIELHVLCEGGV